MSKREEWMGGDSFDFLGSTGKDHRNRKSVPSNDQSKPQINPKELNPDMNRSSQAHYGPTMPPSKSNSTDSKIGDGGLQWKAMKLKRIHEQAQRESKTVEEVAMERFGSLEEYYELERFVNGKSVSSRQALGAGSSSAQSGLSRPAKHRGFSRPGHFGDASASSLQKSSESVTKSDYYRDKSSNSFPSISVPKALSSAVSGTSSNQNTKSTLSTDELNKLKAKAIRAKLLGDDNAEELEAEYQRELRAVENSETNGAQEKAKNVILPTLDSSGRIIDYTNDFGSGQYPENKKRKRLEEHEVDKSVAELLYDEKKSSSRSYDDDFARNIAKNSRFNSSLEYMDEASDKLARQQSQNTTTKKSQAVREFRYLDKALDSCWYCFKDGQSPEIPLISCATRVYLGLPKSAPLVPGHCFIVPLEHYTSMLQCDEGEWEECRNFMKCLVKMAHSQDKGVVFFETAVNNKRHQHTVIECVPIPYRLYDDAYAYFKQETLAAAEEWSQHRKIIDSTKNGFRSSLVKELPYFHVWFGMERSFGHVIENEDSFSRLFGREVIGGMMNLPRDLWRKPRVLAEGELEVIRKRFLQTYSPFDWTEALLGDSKD